MKPLGVDSLAFIGNGADELASLLKMSMLWRVDTVEVMGNEGYGLPAESKGASVSLTVYAEGEPGRDDHPLLHNDPRHSAGYAKVVW